MTYVRQKLEMTHSCKLEDFSCQVFEDSCNVDCSLGSNAHLILGVVLQETLDTTAGELEKEIVSRDFYAKTRINGNQIIRASSSSCLRK